MIPYEELVSALAMWRERNGLPVGAADYLGEPPAPEPVSFAAYESRPDSGAAEIELGDEAEEIAFADDFPESEDVAVDLEPDGEADWMADDAFADASPADPDLDEVPVDAYAAAPADAAADSPWGSDGDELAEAPYGSEPFAAGSETIHEESMPAEVAEPGAAAVSDGFDGDFPAFAEAPAPAADEIELGDLGDGEPVYFASEVPSTVDEDIAVVSSQPPPADYPEIGESTEPVQGIDDLADRPAPAEPEAEPEPPPPGFDDDR
jgi:hypothetical protein